MEFASAVCSDCGASDPGWASLNHGVLICSDCCFVHRNLGRHISQVRSLTKGIWHDKQLALLQFLFRNGANNVWEHSLVDSLGGGGRAKKKPVSNDPIIPKKEAFITAKYAQLAFAIRPAKDEFSVDDLNRQLWSCVRTAHVETALRLLALGACPNYADAEKGNTPLHVAAKEGQQLQAELLWLYGADVGQRNGAGQTPAELAKTEGYNELAERLVELEYEMTDRFSMFLCGRRPSHKEKQHFLIPDLVDSKRNSHIKQFRNSIQKNNGAILERMVQDVYDEVDRRELNNQWNAVAVEHHSAANSTQHVAMFLPPNPRLSATRNQLRQKLAKFSSADFAHLIIDLLKEIRRRHFNLPLPSAEPQIDKGIGGETDCDAGGWLRQRMSIDGRVNVSNKSRVSSNSTKHSSPVKSALFDEQMNGGLSSLDYYLELKEKWTDANEKMGQLASSNAQILNALQQLQRMVEQLQLDQADIRAEFNAQQKQRQNGVTSPHQMFTSSIQNACQSTPSPQQNSSVSASVHQPQVGAVVMSASTLIRPPQQQNKAQSLHQYSTDTYPSARMSSVRLAPLNAISSSSSNGTSQMLPMPPPHHPSSHSVTSMAANSINQKTTKFGSQQRQKSVGSAATPAGHSSTDKTVPVFASNAGSSQSATFLLRDTCDSSTSHSPKSFNNIQSGGYVGRALGSGEGETKAIFNDEIFPDNLILETELLTNAIKALLSDLQNAPSVRGNNGTTSTESNALFHADSINHHIVQILGVIPDVYMRSVQVQNCAIGMEAAMKQLSRRCLARPLCVDSTCQAAYDVAKAAKELLVMVHSKEEQRK